MDINVKSQVIFFPLLIFIIFKLRWSFCWCPCCNGTWLDIDISSLFVVAERHRFYFEGNLSFWIASHFLQFPYLSASIWRVFAPKLITKNILENKAVTRNFSMHYSPKDFYVATSGPVFLPEEKKKLHGSISQKFGLLSQNFEKIIRNFKLFHIRCFNCLRSKSS